MEREKYVDESWKETAELQKEKLDAIAAQNKKSETPKSEEVREQTQVADQEEATQDEIPQAETPQASTEPPSEAEELDENAITFVNYVSSLAFQAMVFLGEVPNPVSNLIDKNLDQAKFLIDTLAMLKVKTNGNLEPQEANMLNSAVYELQMRFVEIQEKENI